MNVQACMQPEQASGHQNKPPELVLLDMSGSAGVQQDCTTARCMKSRSDFAATQRLTCRLLLVGNPQLVRNDS